MNVIVYDYETYWDAQYTLSKMSAIEYVRDARFYAQLLGVSINGAPARVHTHDEIPSVLKSLELDNPTNILIGHNASGFDNLITDEVYGIKPSCVLTDTMHMARWSGLSRVCRETLHDLCEMLGLGVKQAGTEWSKGKRTPDEFEQEEWEKFKAYCAMDVTLTARLVTKLLPYMTTDAIKFSSITCKMATHPAFYVDIPVLQSYLMELKQKEVEAKESLKTLLGVTDDIDFKKQIRSAAKFESMLKILNVEVPMKLSEKKTATAKKKLEEEYTTATPARAAEISAMLADKESYAVYTPALAKTDLEFVALQDHPDPQVQELVRLRLENNSSMPETRTKALLRMGNTRPVPILLKCFYAHTSRYGAGNTEGKSDSLNWQNFSKRMPNMKTIRQAIIPPAGYVVVACDSSQIEARVLAYVACQEDLLEQFAQHRDPYAELAAKFKPGLTAEEIHNGAKAGDKDCKLLRNAGKRAILSGGYGASASRYADSIWKDGVHLADSKEEHDRLAAPLHAIYRQTNYNITNFWKTCTHVLNAMLTKQKGYFGGPTNKLFIYGEFKLPNGELCPSIVLPSGYMLRYPNLRVSSDGRTVVYDRRLGKNIVETRIYGGMLTENCVQSLAFQILMWQAVRMYEAGIQLNCNIHDSFATVVPEAQAEETKERMLEIMRTVPPWVEGLPLDAEAEIGHDFTIV